MESLLLEALRRQYEEIDRLQLAIVEMLPDRDQQPPDQKHRVMQEQTISSLLDQIQRTSQNIIRTYAPGVEEEAIRKELDSITVTPGNFGNFYSHLKHIQDAHRRFPTDRPIDDGEFASILSSARMSEETVEAMFSGEEAYGNYIDLLNYHQIYLNITGVAWLDYMQYLREFDNFENIPKEAKLGDRLYPKYLEELGKYFVGFFSRTKPLFDLTFAREGEKKRFHELWKDAKVVGWTEEAQKLNGAESVFCAPCNHTFTNKSVYQAHLSGKKHQKALQRGTPNPNAEELPGKALEGSMPYKLALMEHMITFYGSLLGEIREETRSNVERKQSRTFEEKEEEAKVSTVEASLPSHEETNNDGKIYNPLNLPLDWDGKPIPYWLWKLHGLGVRFSCEICGNHIYMGRKAFDQHFYEWRHSNGMKALGIPNTRHFFQITQIAEAQSLWDKLKQSTRTETFRPEVMEEFEDQQGNVYSRKTYEDLRRQGLI